jgi:minichromosome maintenance protein 10
VQSKRELSHEDLEEYLTGRYYISPSMLYSVIRSLPNNEGYDVPVVGDWVTIAVVGERGPIRVSRGPTNAPGPDDHDNDVGDGGDPSSSNAKSDVPKPKKGGEPQPPKPTGRKYVNLKLIDFGARSRGSEVGGKAVIRGDAFLSLLLFEADNKEKVPREGGGLPETIYKGGSRGAFERMAAMPEGAVIALLNPRVLKPFNVRSPYIRRGCRNILFRNPSRNHILPPIS